MWSIVFFTALTLMFMFALYGYASERRLRTEQANQTNYWRVSCHNHAVELAKVRTELFEARGLAERDRKALVSARATLENRLQDVEANAALAVDSAVAMREKVEALEADLKARTERLAAVEGAVRAAADERERARELVEQLYGVYNGG